jgi:hypothetical protein
MVVGLVSGILLVPSRLLLTLFGRLELYKLIPKWPQLDKVLTVEIQSLVLLDIVVI